MRTKAFEALDEKQKSALETLLYRLRNNAERRRREANIEVKRGGHIAQRFIQSADEAEMEFYALRAITGHGPIELATRKAEDAS